MHLRNNKALGVLLFSLLATSPFWAVQNQTNPPQAQQRIQPTPLPPDVDPGDPALPVWARPAAPAASTTTKPATPGSQPGTTPQQPISDNSLGEVTKDSSGGFRYTSRVNEVTLSATVLDPKRHLVTNLEPTNFVVYEDGQPQKITSFVRQDIPVSIGIVVDNSGSMRTKRTAVTKAVLNLIQASNPQDEVFVVNFNDDPYLD